MTETFDEWQKRDYDERVKRTSRAYRKSGRENTQARYEKDKKKIHARRAAQQAEAAGKLIDPGACETCGSTSPREKHHPDYDFPLDVEWLCEPCHTEWHKHNVAINGDRPVGMLDRFEKFADKTFDDAAAMYLAEFEGKCLKRQQYALKHIQPFIGHLPLIDVDDQALAEYKATRKKFAMAGTINKEISTATAVLNKACKVWRWIPSAPKLQRVKGDTRKPYPLSWPEQIAMFSRLCGDIQKIALFAVNTGVRREEIFKLRWEDERDIDGVMVFILRETKNGQDRPVVCNSIARRIVCYMRQQADGYRKELENDPEAKVPKDFDIFVFPKVTVSKIMNKAWLAAGLPDDPLVKKGIHNLRHTYGYRLRQAGVPGEDRDALLGHHNQSLTQHYAMPDIERLAELAERVTVRHDVDILR